MLTDFKLLYYWVCTSTHYDGVDLKDVMAGRGNNIGMISVVISAYLQVDSNMHGFPNFFYVLGPNSGRLLHVHYSND